MIAPAAGIRRREDTSVPFIRCCAEIRPSATRQLFREDHA